jgi:hypothetical protein
MLDEETGAEPRVLSGSIADPFLLLIRDDGSVFVAQMDSSYELEEVEKNTGPLTTTKWASGCLYTDSTGVFRETQGEKGADGEKIMMFLLSSTGALHVSRVFQLGVMRETDHQLDLRAARPVEAGLRCRRASVHTAVSICGLYGAKGDSQGVTVGDYGCRPRRRCLSVTVLDCESVATSIFPPPPLTGLVATYPNKRPHHIRTSPVPGWR